MLTGFAAACIDMNTKEELLNALEYGPDPVDMEEWDLTESEWQEAIIEAIDEIDRIIAEENIDDSAASIDVT